jgi:hypothetical protein
MKTMKKALYLHTQYPVHEIEIPFPVPWLPLCIQSSGYGIDRKQSTSLWLRVLLGRLLFMVISKKQAGHQSKQGKDRK